LLRQDLRHGLRAFLRSPGFAAVIVLTLALGIGANTAIFSLLNALVLRDLPVWQPERLVQLSGIYRNGSQVPFSYATFRELERGQRVFSSLIAWTPRYLATYNVEVNQALFQGDVRAVSGNYYSVLGNTPLLGRLISAQDVDAGSPVAVLGYEFWERHFGRDPAAVGSVLRIEGQPFTIIGVTRPWFSGLTPGAPPEITIPLTAGPFRKNLESRALLWLYVTGRLRDGVTPEQASVQLHSFWPQALAATPPTEAAGQRLQSWLAMKLELTSAATGVNRDLRTHFVRPLQILMGIAALILLVACLNLANLTLARAAARSHEMSVRVALGASRWQIARQLLTESALLSLGGALLAATLANGGNRFLVSLMTEGDVFPTTLDLRPDWRVFAFTALVTLGTSVLIALAPAWLSSQAQPASALSQGGRTVGGGAGTLSRALIVTQIALSAVLLIGAGLLLRTFQSLRSVDATLREASVLEVALHPRPGGYQDLDTSLYRRQLIERMRALPGVLSAAFCDTSVPSDSWWRDTVSFSSADTNSDQTAMLLVISPGFFQTLGIPLVAGRDFDWSDDAQHPPTAIVDGNLAHRLAPAGDVIGRRIRFGVQPEMQQLQVVGIARSTRLLDRRNDNALLIYVPGPQHPRELQEGKVLVRTQHPAGLVRQVESGIESLGHEYSAGARTLQQMNEQALLQERATAMLSTLFAALALLLAGIGLFGLMQYTVTRRTREIGVRMALGSQRGRILLMILRESLLLTVAGVAVGLPLALALSRLIEHILFGISSKDPATLATVVITLLAVGGLAGYLPARRAMQTDPMVALRHE